VLVAVVSGIITGSGVGVEVAAGGIEVGVEVADPSEAGGVDVACSKLEVPSSKF